MPRLTLHTRPVRRRHCVGGGAPVNFGRRRRASGPKESTAAAARRRPNIFLNIPEKISFYPQHFLMTFFYSSVENWKIATCSSPHNGKLLSFSEHVLRKIHHCTFRSQKLDSHF